MTGKKQRPPDKDPPTAASPVCYMDMFPAYCGLGEGVAGSQELPPAPRDVAKSSENKGKAAPQGQNAKGETQPVMPPLARDLTPED